MLNANSVLVAAAIVGTVTAIGAIKEWLNGAPEGDGTTGEGNPPEPTPDKTKAAQPKSKGFPSANTLPPFPVGQTIMSGSKIVPKSTPKPQPRTETDPKPTDDPKIPVDPKIVAQPNARMPAQAEDAESIDAQVARAVDRDNRLKSVEEDRQKTEREEKAVAMKQKTVAETIESQNRAAFDISVKIQLEFDIQEKEANLRKSEELVKRVEQRRPGKGPSVGQTDGQKTSGDFATRVVVERLEEQRDKQAKELDELKADRNSMEKGTLSKEKIDRIATTNMVTGKPRVA